MDSVTFDRRFLLLILVIFCFSIPVPAQSSSFKQLQEKLGSEQVFRADFIYAYTDSYTGESSTSSGAIWVNSTSYKLITTDQILVVDGETSRVYDGIRNRLIVSEYVPEDDDFAPSRMLSGINESYKLEEKANSDGSVRILMTSDDDFADYISVELLLNPAGVPVSIAALDFAENESITRFTDGRFIPLNDSLFTLSHPDDTEIIDMRQ